MPESFSSSLFNTSWAPSLRLQSNPPLLNVTPCCSTPWIYFFKENEGLHSGLLQVEVREMRMTITRMPHQVKPVQWPQMTQVNGL